MTQSSQALQTSRRGARKAADAFPSPVGGVRLQLDQRPCHQGRELPRVCGPIHSTSPPVLSCPMEEGNRLALLCLAIETGQSTASLPAASSGFPCTRPLLPLISGIVSTGTCSATVFGRGLRLCVGASSDIETCPARGTDTAGGPTNTYHGGDPQDASSPGRVTSQGARGRDSHILLLCTRQDDRQGRRGCLPSRWGESAAASGPETQPSAGHVPFHVVRQPRTRAGPPAWDSTVPGPRAD